MSLTPFGWAYLPILLAVLALKRSWLLPLLIVSAVLHAPAVAVIEFQDSPRPIGLSPWLVTAAAVFAHLCELVVRQRSVAFGRDATTQRLAIGWALFFGLSVASAFTLPFLFEGLHTFNQEEVQSIAKGTEPLQWRAINAIHAINMAIIAMIFLYVLQLPGPNLHGRSAAVAIVIASAMSLAVLALQRAQVQGVLPEIAQLDASLNPTYAQYSPSFGLSSSILRISWPFSEPSYASVWFGAIYSAGLCIVLFGRRAWFGAVAAVCGLLGVANTMGGSGTAAVLIATAILLFLAIWVLAIGRPLPRARMIARLLLFAGVLVSVTVSVVLVRQHYGLEKVSIQSYHQTIIVPRLKEVERPGNTRAASNREAIRIIQDTGGLGVGLGSNRASSYALSMASTVGLIPAILFFTLVCAQALLILRRQPDSTPTLIILGGSVGALLGAVAGIPDLAWPALWVWIIASFCLTAGYSNQT